MPNAEVKGKKMMNFSRDGLGHTPRPSLLVFPNSDELGDRGS